MNEGLRNITEELLSNVFKHTPQAKPARSFLVAVAGENTRAMEISDTGLIGTKYSVPLCQCGVVNQKPNQPIR